MIFYVIEAFDKETEFLAFEEELPNGYDEQLKAIMGWTSSQQGWEGHNLTRAQLSALEEILGKDIYDSAYLFHLAATPSYLSNTKNPDQSPDRGFVLLLAPA